MGPRGVRWIQNFQIQKARLTHRYKNVSAITNSDIPGIIFIHIHQSISMVPQRHHRRRHHPSWLPPAVLMMMMMAAAWVVAWVGIMGASRLPWNDDENKEQHHYHHHHTSLNSMIGNENRPRIMTSRSQPPEVEQQQQQRYPEKRHGDKSGTSTGGIQVHGMMHHTTTDLETQVQVSKQRVNTVLGKSSNDESSSNQPEGKALKRNSLRLQTNEPKIKRSMLNQQQQKHQNKDNILSPTPRPKVLTTEAGVNVSDASLYEVTDTVQNDDDSRASATVMGMATNYDLSVYQRFVGSLRATGYIGNIILGIDHSTVATTPDEIIQYLTQQNVTIHTVEWTNCTYYNKRNPFFQNLPPCIKEYPNIKPRWSRFPLLARWLQACDTCTGPVLLTDVRDVYFQQDPFVNTTIQGLQVFQEDPRITTAHWITSRPIGQCKNLKFRNDMPMLCSGTTVGTRVAMLKYLEVMYAEMNVWAASKECRVSIDGDDQAIHNYLFYTGQLPFAKSIPNRSGGIVNTVGKIGAVIGQEHIQRISQERNLTKAQAQLVPYDGANNNTNGTWIGKHYNVTDDHGYFIESDGSRSRVVHQWDRFGPTLLHWLEANEKLGSAANG